MKQTASIYQDMAMRTGNSIYIGVVGPVRTGKSTFIKRFMEQLVLPNIENTYRRERARDELPQSGSGRAIMTAEPKFVPEEAVEMHLGEGAIYSVRLIDCVGYMIPGAAGQYEDLSPRMVMTPWYDHPVPMPEAAEMGTRKVINEHSTVGIVVTTDGTATDFPREEYLEAEERVIRELQEIGKPFVVLVNSAQPRGSYCCSVAEEIRKKYHVSCICADCQELNREDLDLLMKELLYAFPLQELQLFLPPWVSALAADHPIKEGIFCAVKESSSSLMQICDLEDYLTQLERGTYISGITCREIDLGKGSASIALDVPRALFYETLSQETGLCVADDGDLMEQILQLAKIKQAYERMQPALKAVEESGYGIIMPGAEQLNLEDPEIVRQGGRFGIRMKASAPSVHLIRADIETTVSPIVGNEKQSEDMINYLLQTYEGDTAKLWQANLFGRSFHEIVSDDLQAKITRLPEESRKKLREALERMINEGSGGLICIIL